MAVAALCRWLALHERQPQPTQQHKLFAREGEVAALAVVDLLRTQAFAEKAGGAVYVAHDEREVAEGKDGFFSEHHVPSDSRPSVLIRPD